MIERRVISPEGQRTGDVMLSRVAKITAIIAVAATGVAFTYDKIAQVRDNTAATRVHTAQIAVMQADIRTLKTAEGAMAYMSCVNFSQTHKPEEVPVFCNDATRGGPR